MKKLNKTSLFYISVEFPKVGIDLSNSRNLFFFNGKFHIEYLRNTKF